jgi:alpha-tubulin suppressor-like RCC1 family protein
MTRMPARLALSLTLVLGGVVALAAPATAIDSCAGPTGLGSGPATANGTVGLYDPSDWYGHTAATALPPRVVTLRPFDGNADLYVYDACGGALLCASTNPGTTIETCLPPLAVAGPVTIEVRHDRAAGSGSNYTLTVDPGACVTRTRVSGSATASIVVPRDDGVAYAWGGNPSGTLRPLPAPVAVNGVTQVTTGGTRTLALDAGGRVWSWLADSSPETIGLYGVTAIAASGGHALAVRADGSVWAWGDNSSGQLGDGTTDDRGTPEPVHGLSGVAAVSAGAEFSLALRCDGTVLAWGRNARGQLGDGTTLTRTLPVVVSGLTGAVAIAAGAEHALALRADGTAWAWGANFSGQVGDGTTLVRRTPVPVGGGRYTALAGGGAHSVALRVDGTVWAWGANSSGQLGDGTTISRAVPGQVPGLTGVRDIGAGTYHTLGVRPDGTVLAWGGNEAGQLGDGGLLPFRPLPLPAPVSPVTVTVTVEVDPVIVDPVGP